MERKSMEEEGLIKKIMNDDVGGSSSYTPHLLFSTFVAVFISFTFGCANGFTSAAQAGIMEDLGLTTAKFSVFASMLTFGAMFGAIASGKVADLVGRKRAMLLMDVCFIVGWGAIIFAKGVWWLYLGRLSLGFGSGLQTYLSPVYVAEIAPKNIRGACAAAVQFVASVGVSATFFLGNVVAWRTLAIIGGLPCLLHVVGLYFIQESPRWLAKVGEAKQLEDTLQCLRGLNADITEEATEIRDSTRTLQHLSRSKFMEMFEKKYALSLIVVIGTLLIVALGGSMGVLFYASLIFEAAGSSVSFGTTAFGIIQIPVSGLAILFLDRSGRRPVLMASLMGAFLGSFIAGLAFLLQDLIQWKELTSTLVLIGILVHLSFFSMGAGIPWVIMAEIIPVNVKGSAGSLATFSNMFTTWIITFVFSFLLEWSPSGTFFVFATFSALGVLFVAKVVPETKGRTLEEIETSMLII